MSRFLNYELTIETIGPLYIGSGETIGKSEYVIYGNKLYVFDIKKMFSGLIKYHIDKAYSKSIMGKKGLNLSYFFRSNRISSETYKKWAKYSYDLPENVDMKTAKNILSFVKDAYSMPYVPGSSVKGALRNAILNGLLLQGKNQRFDKQIESDLKKHIVGNGKFISKNQYLRFNSEKLDEKLFHTLDRPKTKYSNAVNSIFQGITISDSKPLDTNCLILCPKIDVFPKNKGENILKNVVRECIKPKTKILFSLQIDTKIFPYSINDILDFVTATYQNTNLKFLSSFPPTANIHDKNKIYLGGGVGYVSKTCTYSVFNERNRAVKNSGEILDHVDSYKQCKERIKMGQHLKDYEEYGVAPHVRKCTRIDGKLYDMGLCKIDFTTSD